MINKRLPVGLALILALLPGAYHTLYTFRYFQPTWEEFLGSFFPWDPRMAGLWAGHLPRLLAAALFFLSLPGLGGFFMDRLKLGRWRNFFIDSGAALVFWSVSGFLFAAMGLSNPRFLQATSVIFCIRGLTLFPHKTLGRPSLPKDIPSRLLLLGIALIAVLLGLTSLVPDTFYDALVYHLAMPQAYLQAGRLVDMPDLQLTRLPGLIQTLNLWGLAWNDDRLCKLMNLGYGFLWAGALGVWVSRNISRRAGLWTALPLLSCPMIAVNAWSCANDLLCGFFFFLSLWIWTDNDLGPKSSLAGAGLAGFFFGAAAAVKYTALFSAPFFAVAFIMLGLRAPRKSLALAFAFGAGALLPLLPWFIRNGLWTGNPFFPKAAGLLGGDIPENIALLAGWQETLMGEGGFLVRLLSLLRESLTGIQQGRFGFLGPTVLMLLVLLIFLRDRKNLRPLMLCLMISYVTYAAMSGRTRYFIPQLGLLFVLAAVCLEDYLHEWRKPGAWLQGALGILIALNIFWMVLVFQRYNEGWDVVWGRKTVRDYLRQEHIGVYGNPSQKAFDAAAADSPDGKIFVVGEARTFRSLLPAQASGPFNVPAYALWMRETQTPSAFLQKLRKEGYTHLLINIPEMKRITPAPYKTDEHLRFLGTCFDLLSPPIYRDEWTILFKIPRIA